MKKGLAIYPFKNLAAALSSASRATRPFFLMPFNMDDDSNLLKPLGGDLHVDDIWVEVFKNLSGDELWRLRLVSSRWETEIPKHVTLIKNELRVPEYALATMVNLVHLNLNVTSLFGMLLMSPYAM